MNAEILKPYAPTTDQNRPIMLKQIENQRNSKKQISEIWDPDMDSQKY